MARFAQDTFQPKNPKKYVGNAYPIFRSSWELKMFIFLDEHPNVTAWASEPIKIPYRNPVTGRVHNYIPDLMIQYVDLNGKQHVELIEIKPLKESLEEKAKTEKDKISFLVNKAKWESAKAYCKHHGITFSVLTEKELFWRK